MDQRMDQSSATLPYIGNRISLISNAEIRYEGILYSINTFESTVALQNVRSFGTEGRRQPEVAPQTKTYQFIVFKGKDIKDLTVCEPAGQIAEDPAIVNVNVPPSNANIMQSSYQQRPGMMNSGIGDAPHGGQGYNDNSRFGPGGMMTGRMGDYPNHRMGQMPPYPQNNMMGNPNVGGGRGGYYGGKNDMYHPNHPNQRNYSMNEMNMDHGATGRGGKFPGRGGRGGAAGSRPASRRVVGELPAQPNSAMKKEVSKAFDFESSNAKFDKTEGAAAAVVKTESSPTAAEDEATVAASPAEVAATEDNPLATITPTTGNAVRSGYDKTTSFFDTISCETLDRQAGHDARVDRDKQRQLDCETFGAAAAIPRIPRYSRGYRRGVGGRRGGGYGYRQAGMRGGYGEYAANRLHSPFDAPSMVAT